MALKEGMNEVFIEGVLSEKIVREFDNGAIAGEFVIEAPITIGAEDFTSLIPVSFYATPETKAGKPNPAYKSVKNIIDNEKSLAEVGGDYDKASRIRLPKGSLAENMFLSQDGRFVSFARIKGSFFNTVKLTDCEPQATFKVKLIVGSIADEIMKDGDEEFETGRIVVTGFVVQYNGQLDEIKLIVQNKKHIDIVTKGWRVGETVNVTGFIKYTTKEVTEASDEEDSFGEPMVTTTTRRVREFVISGGSGTSVEGYEEEDIAAARKERKARISSLGDKDSGKKTTPTSRSKSADLRDW